MRIPKEFSHKGKVWRVRYEADLKSGDGTECDGLCEFDTRTVFLDSSLKGNKKKATFFHELLHVIVREAHIVEDCSFTEDIEDILADAFADFLVTSFTDLEWKQSK